MELPKIPEGKSGIFGGALLSAALKSPALPQAGVGHARTGTAVAACAGVMHVAPRAAAAA